MSVQELEQSRPAGPVFAPSEVDLSDEAIQRYMAAARRQRSEIIVGGIVRGFSAIRRWLSGRSDAPRGYPLGRGAGS